MKVLEKGPGWSMEVRCTGAGNGGCGCGARLLVERGDIYLTHSYDYGGGHDIYYTIRCPECNVETDIDESKVPSLVKREALDRGRSLTR
ncbi:MAG TPA: hypothetical protein IAC02_05550 [Candidatus Coprovivens excrementavium]|nr:hypothetical protein [Candidatus Coprovivens excrementavium]